MMGKYLSYLGLLGIFYLAVSLDFTSTKKVNVQLHNVTDNNTSPVVMPSKAEAGAEKLYAMVYPPFTGNDFVGFKEALAFKESRGNYFVINRYGYLGKYQFGASTLDMIGVSNTTEFINSPLLQEKAFLANTERNKWILRNYINRYVGKKVHGVLITESGILAAAHLAGAGNVKKFLRSGGSYNFGDANGATVKYYMKKFGGYDVSEIRALRTSKVNRTV